MNGSSTPTASMDNVEDGKIETYDLTKSGITDPDLVWRFGRWRLADMALRLDLYEVTQGIESLQHVPGDLVAFQHHAALLGLTRGRIKSRTLNGSNQVIAVTIDDLVTFETGKTYSARVRLIDDAGAGQFVERAVQNDAGGTLFAEAWTGSNGAAWPTARWNAADLQGTGSSATIQANAGRLLATGEATARARVIAKSGPLTNFSLFALVTIATGGQTANNEFHNLNFRASGAWSATNEQDRLHGYSLELAHRRRRAPTPARFGCQQHAHRARCAGRQGLGHVAMVRAGTLPGQHDPMPGLARRRAIHLGHRRHERGPCRGRHLARHRERRRRRRAHGDLGQPLDRDAGDGDGAAVLRAVRRGGRPGHRRPAGIRRDQPRDHQRGRQGGDTRARHDGAADAGRRGARRSTLRTPGRSRRSKASSRCRATSSAWPRPCR